MAHDMAADYQRRVAPRPAADARVQGVTYQKQLHGLEGHKRKLEIHRRVKAGETQAQVARAMGLSASRVQQIFHVMERRANEEPSDRDKAIIEQWRERGWELP